MDKQRSWNLGYWLVALVALLMLQSLWQSSERVELLPYSEFERYLAEGRVAEVVVTDRALTGLLKSPDNGKTAVAAARVEPDLAQRLDKCRVPYRRVVESTVLRDILSWVAPAVVFFALWFFLAVGFSGADLANLVNEAAIAATRR